MAAGDAVTNRDLLLALLGTQETLVKDVSEIKATIAPAVVALTDHENRIRTLEQTDQRFTGVKAAVGVSFSVVCGLSGLVLGVLAYFG